MEFNKMIEESFTFEISCINGIVFEVSLSRDELEKLMDLIGYDNVNYVVEL
jgi:hypothetical protein